MGVSTHLNNTSDKKFNAYMQGFKAAMKFLTDNHIAVSEINLKKFLTAYSKQYIALSMNNKELWQVANVDKLEALNPAKDKNGRIIKIKDKSPPLEFYLNNVVMNGNKTVKYEYINSSKNQFNLKEYMFNRATNNAVGSNKNGVLDIEKYKDNNDTYKILADINSRLISTDNMHMVKILRDIEFEVKNMYNQNTPILYYQDIITDF